MKKIILLGMATATLVLSAISCNKSKEEAVVAETQAVVGDVVDMPSEPGDTAVIATGEAIAVEEPVQTK